MNENHYSVTSFLKKYFNSLLNSLFFVCFDSLRPSQQSFSYVRTGLPGLNQY